MTQSKRKRFLTTVLMFPVYWYVFYVYMLGLPRFAERHPDLDHAITTVFQIAFRIAMLGIVLYYAIISIRAFREGIREANQRRS